MSQILHQRTVNVAISANQAGHEFADAPHDIQAAFLSGFMDGVDDWDNPENWTCQCRTIVREINDGDRRHRLAAMLQGLVDHLLEPKAEPTR
jgi:hypothetical protein